MMILPMPLNVLPISNFRQISRGLCGVYFIIQGDEVTYIGQSGKCMFSRILEATKRWPTITHIAYYIVPTGKDLDRIKIEEKLIRFWSPTSNHSNKPYRPYWEDENHPDITEKPRFWFEYTQAAAQKMVELELVSDASQKEINRCQALIDELIEKNRRYKLLTKVKRAKRNHNALEFKQEFPHIGGVLVSRATPLLLQTSPRQTTIAGPNAEPLSLPVWVPRAKSAIKPQKMRFSWLWKKIGQVLFGIA